MAQHAAPTRQRSGAGAGLGAVLLILGIVFLAQHTLGFVLPSVAWPVWIIAVGLGFFVAMAVAGKGAAGLAIPGSIITTVGLILAYQDYFGRYETWAYAWALIVVAVGLGLLIKGFWTDDPKAFRAGLRTAGTGAVLFVVFGALFEVGIRLGGIDYSAISGWFWPVLMIVVGVVLLLRRGVRR